MAEKLVGAVCPDCGSKIVKSDKYIFCEKSGKEAGLCHFITGYVLSGGSKIPDSDLVKLTKGEKIGPYTFHSEKKNKDYEASLQFDRTDGRVHPIYENHFEETNHLCPLCSERLVKREGVYGPYLSCPNRDFNLSCSFGGVELTNADMDTILRGGTTAPLTLYSRKKQTEYEACLKLDPETLKITPVFE